MNENATVTYVGPDWFRWGAPYHDWFRALRECPRAEWLIPIAIHADPGQRALQAISFALEAAMLYTGWGYLPDQTYEAMRADLEQHALRGGRDVLRSEDDR